MIKRLLAMGLIVWLCMPLLGYAQVKDEPKETLTYLYKDALGSTIAKADETGKIIWQKDYLPYGKQTGDPWGFQPVSNTLQYTNAAEGPNGLLYLKARYYNPEIGRFYAVDPVWFRDTDIQSFGRYTYASNNPYRYIDPTGMQNDDPPVGYRDNEHDNFDSNSEAVYGAMDQVGYGIDTYKGEIAAVATGVGAVSMMGTAAIVAGAKEAVSEVASEITGGLSDFVSVKGLFNKALKSPTEIAKIMESSKYSPTQSLAKMDIEKINTYSKAMKQGKWDWSGGKIVVDKNNSIMDGHHRAIAAEKAGVAVPESAKINFNGITERPSYDWSGKLKD